MKPKSIKSLLALALLAPGALFAQTTAKTTPVGYHTETLVSGQFNLVGMNVHSPVISSGVISAEAADKVTVAGVDFTALLTSGATYVLELPDGTIQEITSWTATELSTPQDISGFITPATTTFKLRKAKTISEIFGATNTAGLQATDAFDSEAADLVYVQNASAGFDRYFYSNLEGAEGWFNASDFSGANDIPVVYTDSLLLLRRGATDLDVVFSGEVKKEPTSYALLGGQFNYLSTVYPAGITLANSGLATSLTPTDAFDSESADLVYIQNATAGYDRYFYSNLEGAEGWFNASDFSTADTTPIKSGLIVLRRGAATTALLTPEASIYSTL